MAEACSTEDACYSPVQSELTHRLQDVHLPGLSELLAPDAAHDETARPSYACAEVMPDMREKEGSGARYEANLSVFHEGSLYGKIMRTILDDRG